MPTPGTRNSASGLPNHVPGGVYSVSMPSLSDGNYVPLQVDNEGNLLVNVAVGGGGGGGNASVGLTGGAILTSATFIGVEDTDTSTLVGLTSTDGLLNTSTEVFSTFIGDSTATWNNSTALNSELDTIAEGTAATFTLVQTGTLSTGAVTFEQSQDGTNWAPIQVLDNTTGLLVTSYTFVTATNRSFSGGYTNSAIRARLSTAITGSGSVIVQQNTFSISTEQPVGTQVVQVSNFPTTQPVSGTISVSNFPATQAVTQSGTWTVGISGNPADNIAQWGGTAVAAAATTTSQGSEAAPIVRVIQRKSGVPNASPTAVLSTTPLAANASFTSAWVDTFQTGDCFVTAVVFPGSIGSASNGFSIQVTNDTGTTSTQGNISQTSIATAGVAVTLTASITYRYWRINYTNGATPQVTFELTAVASSVPQATKVSGDGSISGGVTTTNAVPCSLAANIAVPDGAAANSQLASNGTGTLVGTSNSVYNGSGWDRARSVAGAVAAGTGTTAVVDVPTTSANQACSVTGQSALTVVNVKNAAGNVFGVSIANPNASTIFLQFYNSASTPSLGTSVVWWLAIGANFSGTLVLPYAINFTTGIGIGAATTATGGTAPGTAPSVTVFYA